MASKQSSSISNLLFKVFLCLLYELDIIVNMFECRRYKDSEIPNVVCLPFDNGSLVLQAFAVLLVWALSIFLVFLSKIWQTIVGRVFEITLGSKELGAREIERKLTSALMEEENVVNFTFETLVTDVGGFENLMLGNELPLSNLDLREEEDPVDVDNIDEKEPHDDMGELTEAVAVLSRKKYRHASYMVRTTASFFLPATYAVNNY
ncbi:hypothetical protein BJ508DRAFT_315199 [Ascobolus immersus RN42]|uniref:Uncharacterized protein n=1 Tax=Ascobolus immersus RN42 TaxID=1160509 RepID=A0A3N4HI26_ASCIM|nr:hypothetical protein BJ508DRAFT_315199 [Ascobolus immersus RN42]